MSITNKTVMASVKSVNDDTEAPYGAFDVILSAQTKDRDGDILLKDGWKLPLPEHIPFDIDHGMSIEKTVGSGKPFINDNGDLQVRGTFASTPLGQTVRSLVSEGHIRSTSVAFMSEKSTAKDGTSVTLREVLNGAFVNTPSNREAIVLGVKDFDAKSGARNSQSDASHIQAIHDHAAALGASHDTAADKPAPKSFTVKDADTEDQSDPAALIQACDAAIDQAIDLFAAVDITTLPAEIQQAIALVQAADAAIDELMDVAGIPDPDEDAEPAPTAEVPVAVDGKSSPAAATKPVGAVDVDSDAVTDIELRARALQMVTAQYI